jgi:hypothetical protein
MRNPTLLAATLALAVPMPALAQQSEAGRMAERLSDPDYQQQLAETVAVMGEILLDMPLAPMAEALAEMAGDDPASVDPDLTLRKAAPGAGRVPEEMADRLPRMMDGLAGMASGIDAMLPALRTMAVRMEESMGRLRQSEMHR